METTYNWIEPESIETFWHLNPREKDDRHVRSIARHMNKVGYRADFPLIVYHINEIFVASTGHHRIAAALTRDDEFPNLPLKKVFCEIRQGTMDDVIRTMMTDNFQWSPSVNPKLGKMPSRAEIRNMRYRLMLFPDNFRKSERLLAQEWNCNHFTVGKIRDEILEGLSGGWKQPPPYFTDAAREEIECIIQRDMYVGIDGKEYPRTSVSTPTKQPTPQPDPDRQRKPETIQTLLQTSGYVQDSITEFADRFEHLEPGYCQRRIFAVVGKESNIGCQDWELDKLQSQLQIASSLEETLDEADLSNLTDTDNPVHALLSELMVIHAVVNVYSELDAYSRPFLHGPLNLAVEKLQRVKTADWESKPRTERMTDLEELLADYTPLKNREMDARNTASKAADDARRVAELKIREDTEIEAATDHLHSERTGLDSDSQALCTAWQDSACTGEYDDFLAVAADAFSCDFYELRNIVDYENKNGAQKFRFELSLKSLQIWRGRVVAMCMAIDQKPEWILPLLQEPELDRCRAELETQHFDQGGTLDGLDFGRRAIEYNCTAEDVEKIATELWGIKTDAVVTAEEATQMERDYPTIENPTAEPVMRGNAEKVLVGLSIYYEDTTKQQTYKRSMRHYSDDIDADNPMGSVPESVREALQVLLNS